MNYAALGSVGAAVMRNAAQRAASEIENENLPARIVRNQPPAPQPASAAPVSAPMPQPVSAPAPQFASEEPSTLPAYNGAPRFLPPAVSQPQESPPALAPIITPISVPPSIAQGGNSGATYTPAAPLTAPGGAGTVATPAPAVTPATAPESGFSFATLAALASIAALLLN